MHEWHKKYRPTTLDRVVGNEETVAALRGMLERRSVPHALLFTGPSGCGKTTLARIVKDELECHDFDYREMNSSAFRGIDTIRDIQSNMTLAPAAGPVRVWLMDEVHQLSKDAQNAALKMLEDTPAHVYFMLCTTDPDKLITAVRTRCTEMPVRGLTQREIESLAARVEKKERVDFGADVLDAIVAAADGSARLALVMMEKVATIPAAQRAAAIEATKAAVTEGYDLCKALINRDPWEKVCGILANLKSDPETVRWNVLGYARAVLINPRSKPATRHQAYIVIDCFGRNFYDSKAAGLAYAAFEAINHKDDE